MDTQATLAQALENEFGLRNFRPAWLRRQTEFSAAVLSGPISRTDICEITEGTLPWNIANAHSVKLGTKVLVQIEDVINIANSDPRSPEAPKVLQMTLTDGSVDFVGVELESFGGRISLKTVPGTKLMLHPSALIRRGRVLLAAKDFTLLNGPTSNIWGSSYDDEVAKALDAAGLHNPKASSFDSIARTAGEGTNRSGNARLTGPLDMGGIADAVPDSNEDGIEDEQFWAEAASLAHRSEIEASRSVQSGAVQVNRSRDNDRARLLETSPRLRNSDREVPKRDALQRPATSIVQPVEHRPAESEPRSADTRNHEHDIFDVDAIPDVPICESDPVETEPLVAGQSERNVRQDADAVMEETGDFDVSGLPLSRLDDIGSSHKTQLLLIRAFVAKPRVKPKIRYESSRISVLMPFDDGTNVTNLLLRQNLLQDLTGIDFHGNENMARGVAVINEDEAAESSAAHQIRRVSRGICGFIQVHDAHGCASVSGVFKEPPGGFVC